MHPLKKAADHGLSIALPIAILGAGFRLAHWRLANEFLIIGLGSVAFWGFVRFALEKTLEGYATGFAIAIACMAILFKLEHWPNADLLIKAAIAAGLVLGAIMLFARNNRPVE